MILFTGRYPRGLFSYVEAVIAWHNRVAGYAAILVTDEYPPFALYPEQTQSGQMASGPQGDDEHRRALRLSMGPASGEKLERDP